MGKELRAKGFLASALLLASLWGHAQDMLTDTAFLSTARTAAVKRYSDRIAEQSNLVNGVEYKEFQTTPLTTGYPYFLSDDWIDGDVFYDSGYYAKVPLMFDLIHDKLILEQPFSHFKLELISEKIKYFRIAGHTFVRIVRAKSDSSLVTGFYDLLYDGKVKVYARRGKEIKETPEVGGVVIEYFDKASYLIEKDNRFYFVKHRRAVYKVFEDRKKMLKKAMRASGNQINYLKQRDEALAWMAKLYDESGNK